MGYNGDLYPTAGASVVMTTKGDMVDYDTERQRLGIGSTGQVLTVASSLPTWSTLTTADSVLTTQGDVLYESASGLARLGFGTSGDVLTTKGTGANPVWQTPATAAGVETGTILPYGGDTSDSLSDYLFCDGSAVSRTTYSDLFAVIGTNFGVGDGSTTFNVPNMQSKFPRGTSSAQGGATGGADSLTLTEAQMPTHNHSINDSGHSHDAPRNFGTGSYYAQATISNDNYTYNAVPPTSTETTGITINDAGSSDSFDNKPAYLELLYIIKT